MAGLVPKPVEGLERPEPAGAIAKTPESMPAGGVLLKEEHKARRTTCPVIEECAPLDEVPRSLSDHAIAWRFHARCLSEAAILQSWELLPLFFGNEKDQSGISHETIRVSTHLKKLLF